MVGDRIIIPANSYIMIHHALAPVWGNAIEMRKMANTLDTIDEGILEVYKSKLKDGVDLETIKQLIDEETWLTGKQASEYFNIEVGEDLEAVAYCGDISNYKNIPDGLVDKKGNKQQNENTTELALAKAKLRLLTL